MSMNNPSISLVEGKKHTTISYLLLGGLLFLRFPFLIGANLILPPALPRTIAMFVFIIGTYLLSAVLIWWEREHLRDFWIDLAASVTFLLNLFCFPIGIGLFRAMRRHQARFPAPPANLWRWALLGAVLAITCNIFVIAGLGIEPPEARGAQPAGFGFLIPALLLQLTMAGVLEEPLFRGFLWGYLRRASWKDGWIWPFQALLFTLGHVYYLQTEAIGLWFLRIALPALLIGFIAWRAKSIFASMVTHAFFNASGDVLLHSRSLSEAIKFGWTAILVILVIFAAGWIVEWISHRQMPVTS